ncbi:MAG: D-alanine--D-alanine ligase [Planctomycetota bacterium]|nr:D-alanine--D-alanine ligase [Planctomycetota bacterium]
MADYPIAPLGQQGGGETTDRAFERTFGGQAMRVLVLGGGPDAEREISLVSAKAVADALRQSASHHVDLVTIDRATQAELASKAADVIVPVLHGPWGEGGPLQDELEKDGRAFVGCGAAAARIAMDKVLTKSVALRLGVPTPDFAILRAGDPGVPLPLPVVVKPVHEGSSVGLHVCRTAEDWSRARAAVEADLAEHPRRVYMVERMIEGIEITAGLLDPLGKKATLLPLIQVVPATGTYDYKAKYTRDDTKYVVAPSLLPGVELVIGQYAMRLARGMGVRHVCRMDFMVDRQNTPWLLEVNTMPGFTDHSLVPMAARRLGMEMPALCERLVEMAMRDHGAR